MQHMNKQTAGAYGTGALLCLIAAVSWGGSFVVMGSALKHIDPFTINTMRYGLAGILFVAFLVVREGRSALSMRRERWGLAWVCGTAGFAGFGFLTFFGQKLAGPRGALSASIMMTMMPPLGALLSWLLTGKRPTPLTFAFIGLSTLGALIVLTKGDLAAIVYAPESNSANLLLVAGATCWVYYTMGATYFPEWSPYRYTALTTMLGMTSVIAIDVILIALGFVKIPTLNVVLSIAPHLLYLVTIASFVAVLSWNVGNKKISAVNGVLFMNVAPLTTFIISAMTGVVPTTSQFVGGTITALSLTCNNIYQRRRMAAHSMSK